MNQFPDELLKFIRRVPSQQNNKAVILGGGLTGLAAGYGLAKAGMPVALFESDSTVGGLSKTLQHGEFRYDLGGHRFHTKNIKTDRFVRNLLKGDYLTVPRKSKIYLQDRFFDYPLKPVNALFGLGLRTSLKAVTDYSKERLKSLFSSPDHVSLEDWVVSNFGRTMFDLYFREYSEKVWGIPCSRISEEWVSTRIKGLSLGVAIKNAFSSSFNKGQISTLIDEFIYPPLGIGQISDRMQEAIEKRNNVLTNTKVTRIEHKDYVINGIEAQNCSRIYDIKGSEFVSSIPLNQFVRMLDPLPPRKVLDAAACLGYRDLMTVTIMLNKDRVTDLTWMYIPEKKMPLGRIHEPRNWSPLMAPVGKTHIVAEYFCFKGDRTWEMSDEDITSITVDQLETLGLISRKDVIDSAVMRVPKAYPLFEVGYTEHYSTIMDYLKNFSNLHMSGRTGMFKYYNMDRAIESGLEAAETILRKSSAKNVYRSQPVGA